MKTSFSRLVCLVLIVLMALAVFTACGDDETTENSSVAANVSNVNQEPAATSAVEPPVEVIVPQAGSGFTIKEQDTANPIVQYVKIDGAEVLEILEGTTVEVFKQNVLAEAGYTLKVFTEADSKEVSDNKATFASGTNYYFQAIKDDATSTGEVTKHTISVKTKAELQETVSAIVNASTVATASKAAAATSSTATAAKPGTALSGYTFTFGTCWPDNYSGTANTAKINTKQINAIKAKYGCTITMKTYQPVSDNIVKEVLAGKKTADIIEVSMNMCRELAQKSAICDLAKCTTLNKKVIANAMTNAATFNGKIFGAAYNSMSACCMGVLFNKKIVNQYASAYNIYSLYSAKKWTFDAFEAVAKACTVDTDGDKKTNIYGIASNTNIIGMALTANAGGTALMVNGRVMATMCEQNGIDALEWMKKIYKAKYWDYKPDITVSVTSFANGEAAMFVSYLKYFTQIATSADFEMGFVPMPIGPAQKNYISGTYDGQYFVVPKTNEKNLNAVGLFLTDYSAISPLQINEYIATMKRNGLDSTAQAVYKWSVTNCTPEYSTGPFTAATSAVVDTSVTSNSRSPSKNVAAIKSSAQAECDDYYKNLY